ncbi:MAG TPA: homoserine kinase [Burkholderiales bacterium]|nr:homoserine kinase [Burkholderiales bacterium]
MSVYTKVTEAELTAWLSRYEVGSVLELRGIAAGIENTNYFVTTEQGRYVLTLFERLASADLPFYLGLMTHLAERGIPCPLPIATKNGGTMAEFKGKPAALFTRLSGATLTGPTTKHCAAVGAVLADMHLAGRDYAGQLENPRGPKWWNQTAPQVMRFLNAEAQALLQSELAFQAAHRVSDLPRGPIHADLFRDNVLFEGEQLTGALDFYFAGIDAWLFDVAVTLNDWCVEADGKLDHERAQAFLRAYHARRPLTGEEHREWPVMLRAAALRFWLSRLYDFHLPRPGELVHAHDPEHFRRILQLRISEAARAPWPKAA